MRPQVAEESRGVGARRHTGCRQSGQQRPSIRRIALCSAPDRRWRDDASARASR